MKVCTLCETEKHLIEFSKRKDRKDGLHFWCKPCLKIKKAESYQKNREKALAHMAAYRKANPEKVAAAKKAAYEKKPEYYRAMGKKRYAENPGACAAKTKAWNEKNKEHVKARSAVYRERNRQELNAKQLEYYRANKEKVIAYQGKYISRRYREDHLFAIRMICRRRLLFAMAKGGYKKSSKTEAILGCSFTELVQYIESKFLPGMTWENRGMFGWHLDHIIPLASASCAEEVEKLSHYTNLQPMWAADNWSKGAKMPPMSEDQNHGRLGNLQTERR